MLMNPPGRTGRWETALTARADFRMGNTLAVCEDSAISHTLGFRQFRFSAMSAVTLLPPLVQEPIGTLRSTPVSRYMKSDLIDKAAKVIPHPPVLINLVSRRVRQLNQGRAPLINTANYGPRLGQGDIALIEIIEGLITAEMLNTPDGGVAAG